MGFEAIAEFTRVFARISLILFAMAFVVEALRDGKSRTRLLWASFLCAHIIHLASLMLYYNALGESPKLDPVLALLIVGVAALGWMIFITLKTTAIKNRLYITPAIGWYLWFLFTATHVSRLLDTERAGAINWVLLTVMLLAGAVRILLFRKHTPHPD
ncbi:MAG: hypothetical protein COA69_03810 [Robiginitomaculum sp.]|nr:MAG: hypothetical protein COA69_03810 [Robiginitomaculum sp.]